MSTFRTKIGPSGRLIIPAVQRRELGLAVGDEVVLEVAEGELRLTGLKQRIARVQALMRRHNPQGETLSESLIRGRRAEADRE